MPKTKSVNYKRLILTNLKDKYPYILTGFVVILLVITFITKISQNKNVQPFNKTVKIENIQNKPAPKEVGNEKAAIKTYTVQKGDHLWKIAEEVYGSGYNAYDIAKANNIENPSLVYAGQNLIIPDVEIKTPTRGEITAAKTTQVVKKIDKYTVQKGDNLWNIAIQAYGDGFGWTKIAKLNKLDNPGLIFAGQVLRIE